VGQSPLCVRGFPDVWCSWIQQLQETAKSAVLLNGVPGRWIPCRKGLRQGDPLSSYLFILVADVLQRMLTRDAALHHPLAPDRPCVVLQYADDTLIVARADDAAVLQLKALLCSFTRATGLSINYTKSTLVPTHILGPNVESYVGILGCSQGSFPQTYLGLPLSNEKLNLAAYAPIITSADKYLSGWWASLLNHQGRLVLVNAVLDSLPVYAIGAVQLPPRVMMPWTRVGGPSCGPVRNLSRALSAWSAGTKLASPKKRAASVFGISAFKTLACS
jgi:hypothetical protein